MSSNRFIGILLIFLGLIILACFFLFDKNKLIYNESRFSLIKYFPIILIRNGGILFIVLGVLFYKKFLIPYFSEAITKFEKAKNIVVYTSDLFCMDSYFEYKNPV